MTDVWSERAEMYRTSEAHREGPDLDLLVEWAAGARTALDVATGGGHVARRLREAGIEVVTLRSGARDAAGRRLPGRGPALRRRELRRRRDAGRCAPLRGRRAGGRRDGAGRLAAVLIVDNVFMGEDVEEAERLRDPSHVRNYSEAEWRSFAEAAGLARRRGAVLREADRAAAVARPLRLRGRGGRARRRAARRPCPAETTSCSTGSRCSKAVPA